MSDNPITTLILPTCALVFAQVYLFVLLNDFRFERRFVHRLCVLFCVFSLTLCHTVSYLLCGGERTAACTLFTLILPGLLFEWIVSRHRGARFIFTCCISTLSVCIVDFCAYLMSNFIMSGNEWLTVTMRVVNVLLWCIAMRLMVGTQYRRALNVVEKNWGVLILVVLSMYALLTLIALYPTAIAERPGEMPTATVMSVVLLLMVVVLLQMIYNSMDATERRQKETVLRGQLELSRTQHELLSAQYDEIRRLRHDMKYHMNVLSGYVRSGNYEKLADYLQEYQAMQAVLNEPMPVFTKNATVNALAAHYDARAKEAGIHTEWILELPETLAVDEVALAAVLGNALQNALEGCLDFECTMEKHLRCKAFLKKNKLILRVENTAGAPKQSGGRLLSHKPAHTGIGLASIESVTELNHGHCQYFYRDGTFTLEVVLPLLAAES